MTHATSPIEHGRRRRGERGSAVVLCLLALLLVSMLGGMLLVQAKTETQISGHHQRHTQALYNAEAGYAEALARMSANSDTTLYIGQGSGWQSAPGWGCYVVRHNGASASDPDYMATVSDGLDNDGDGSIDESDEHFVEVPTIQGLSGIDYPWVKVQYMLDAGQVVLFGDHDHDVTTPPVPNTVSGNPILVVTSNGSQGSARRTVAVEAIRVPLEVPYTAAYSESDQFQFNGTQFLISGNDWDPATGAVIAGNPTVPGLVTTGDPGVIAGALNAQQQNNVEGSGGTPSVQPSPVNLDLEAIRDQYADMAEVVFPGGTYTGGAWGTYEDYTIVHCTGPLTLSGANAGGGVLIVDGDLDCSGQFTWYGLVVVLGDIFFTGGGGGIHIYGSVLSTGSMSQQVMAGNTDILYSSIALNRLANLFPYIVASWREI
jgi:hypothetical protein